ncbi:MAG: F0F1 ATP synthase subunit gamma, partial [Flavobacteriales bacterium]
MQITSAMKMVSAAKLKPAQEAITQMRPSAHKLQEILGNLTSSLDTSDNAYAQERELKNVLIVGINSNRGLCGGFNNNVAKRVKLIASEYKNSNVNILPIGKKMADSINNTDFVIKGKLLPSHTEELWNDLSFEGVSEVAQNLM